jgi:hypothetical protein
MARPRRKKRQRHDQRWEQPTGDLLKRIHAVAKHRCLLDTHIAVEEHALPDHAPGEIKPVTRAGGQFRGRRTSSTPTPPPGSRKSRASPHPSTTITRWLTRLSPYKAIKNAGFGAIYAMLPPHFAPGDFSSAGRPLLMLVK